MTYTYTHTDTYTEWAELTKYGKGMLEEFTPETLENINKWFSENGFPETVNPEYHPDNFYCNVIEELWSFDLDKYGYTYSEFEEASLIAYYNPEGDPDFNVTCHEALERANSAAYAALATEWHIFGWTNDGNLVAVKK